MWGGGGEIIKLKKSVYLILKSNNLSFLLHPDNHRNHHRFLGRFLEKIFAHGIRHVVFYIIKINRLHAGSALLNGLLYYMSGLGQQFLGFAQVDKAAGNDIR